MHSTINIYCDESCHLLNDHQGSMVVGALWCFASKATQHKTAIAGMKALQQQKKCLMQRLLTGQVRVKT